MPIHAGRLSLAAALALSSLAVIAAVPMARGAGATATPSAPKTVASTVTSPARPAAVAPAPGAAPTAPRTAVSTVTSPVHPPAVAPGPPPTAS